MTMPVVFNVTAIWSAEACVWSGHCGEIPTAAQSATLDGLVRTMSLIALDLTQIDHPEIEPDSIYIQLNARREAARAAA